MKFKPSSFADLQVGDQRPSFLDELLKTLMRAGLQLAPDVSEGNMAEEEWERQDEERDAEARYRLNKEAGFYDRSYVPGNNKFTRSLDQLLLKRR